MFLSFIFNLAWFDAPFHEDSEYHLGIKFDLVLAEKIRKNLSRTSIFDVFSPKVFLNFLYENNSFLNFFLSKCLELKVLSTLKTSQKPENFFVRCGRDPVEIPTCIILHGGLIFLCLTHTDISNLLDKNKSITTLFAFEVILLISSYFCNSDRQI